jgi:hypothetical protein
MARPTLKQILLAIVMGVLFAAVQGDRPLEATAERPGVNLKWR